MCELYEERKKGKRIFNLEFSMSFWKPKLLFYFSGIFSFFFSPWTTFIDNHKCFVWWNCTIFEVKFQILPTCIKYFAQIHKKLSTLSVVASRELYHFLIPDNAQREPQTLLGAWVALLTTLRDIKIYYLTY